ncbi:MAG: response regulator [Bryobacteraceae bacterium]
MPNQRVVAVLDDLFFTVKILDAAKRAGMTMESVKSEIDAIDKARSAPALMIIDLNCGAIDPVRLITALKADPETKRLNLIGFISHVQGELKLQAQQAGCDMVLARSAFSQNLPQLLKRYA